MSPTHSSYASLLDVLQRRQGVGFVGRAPFIERFQQNLSLDFADPARRYIFFISGVAGSGKTWLMRQMQRLAELEKGVQALWVSGETQGPLAAMVRPCSPPRPATPAMGRTERPR